MTPSLVAVLPPKDFGPERGRPRLSDPDGDVFAPVFMDMGGMPQQ